jgi:hypothetical protein
VIGGPLSAALGAWLLIGAILPLARSYQVWREHHLAGRWVPVPCKLESAKLVERVPARSDNPPRYSTAATYSYTFEGRTYRSSRVDFTHGESFSEKTIRKHRFATLEDHLQTGAPILGWVDPDAPTEAVLFIDLPPSAYMLPLVGLLFGWLSLRLLVGGILKISASRRRAALLREHPARPWLAEGRWDGLGTRSRSPLELVPGWLATLYVSAVAGVFVFLCVARVAKSAGVALTFVFAGIAVLALASMGYRTLQHLKWGRARLRLLRSPVRPGETLEGMLFCGRRVEPEDGFHLTLLCVTDVPVWGKGRRRTLYEAESVVRRDLLSFAAEAGTAIPIRLVIPADQPASSIALPACRI